jgi:hypothetical protein
MISPVRQYAIIPSRDRREMLKALVNNLTEQGLHVVIVDNGYDPKLEFDPAVKIISYNKSPNLSQMWNIAFNYIEGIEWILETKHWNVSVFNDDTLIPDHWIDYVSDGLRENDVVIACTDPYGTLTQPLIKRSRDGNISTRMCPWAFMVRGEAGLRADENMAWWWGDTDLDWQACENGGVLLLPGCTTQNTLANSTTFGALAEQAGRDAEYFAQKWGGRPW